jgi:hypothetical protein
MTWLILVGLGALIGTVLGMYLFFGSYWYRLSQLDKGPVDD